jgi:hypothetical protein
MPHEPGWLHERATAGSRNKINPHPFTSAGVGFNGGTTTSSSVNLRNPVVNQGSIGPIFRCGHGCYHMILDPVSFFIS